MSARRPPQIVHRARIENDDDRHCGLSARAYQARVDLCRVWELMQQNRSQADIARIMDKDPAWVCRSVRRIREDFSAVFQRENEAAVVDGQLARLESLYATALQTIESSDGMAKVAAIRTATSILREKQNFMQFVGLMRKQQENPPFMQLARGF